MGTISADRPTDAIAALLQERQRYEQWLQALESRRASTAPLVYTRVRQDYEGRLARVLDEISGRSAELRQVIASLSAQVTTLQAEEATKRDLQSEAELRAAVGEYSQEQWRQFSQAGEAEIGRIVARRAEAAAELAQVQQLLNMAGTRRPTVPPQAGDVPAAAPGSAAAFLAPPPAAPRVDRPSERAAFDELAFLHSVVEPKPGDSRQVGARAAVADAAPRSSAPAPGPQAPAPVAPAAPARQVAPPAAAPASSPAPRQVAPAAPVQSSRPIAPSLSITLGGPAIPSGEVEREADVLEDAEVAAVPSFLRDVPLEQVKTLKCAECGTMNFATEWYCERCGGELAAM